MNRVDWFYKTGELSIATYFRTKYNIHHEGQLPKDGPYVLLPKHQSGADIPLEGNFIRRQTGRLAYFVMRGFPFPFNHVLEWCGGIQVARPKDIRKGKISKEQAREINERATMRVIDCLREGEPVVIHPEGTRFYKKMGEININPNSIIGRIIEEYAGTIPFIPFGIEYERTNIWLRVGEPVYTTNPSELEKHLIKEIARLSGLRTCNNTGTS